MKKGVFMAVKACGNYPKWPNLCESDNAPFGLFGPSSNTQPEVDLDTIEIGVPNVPGDAGRERSSPVGRLDQCLYYFCRSSNSSHA
jgi:hypothetical protein